MPQVEELVVYGQTIFKNMKTNILIILFFLVSQLSFSQISIGITTSIGGNDEIKISVPSIIPLKNEINILYSTGAFVDYAITKKIHIKTELSLIKKGYIVNFYNTIHNNNNSKFVEKFYLNNYYCENPIFFKLLTTKFVGINLGIINNFLLFSTSFDGYIKQFYGYRKRSTTLVKYNIGAIVGLTFNPIKKLDISLNLKSDLMPYYKDRNTNSLTQGYNYGLMLSVSYNLFSF